VECGFSSAFLQTVREKEGVIHNGTSFVPLKWYLRSTFQRSRGLPRRTLLVSSEYENLYIILDGMTAHFDNSCSPSIVRPLFKTLRCPTIETPPPSSAGKTAMSTSHQTSSGNHPFHPRLSPLLSFLSPHIPTNHALSGPPFSSAPRCIPSFPYNPNQTVSIP
jgi:hypothetical protein